MAAHFISNLTKKRVWYKIYQYPTKAVTKTCLFAPRTSSASPCVPLGTPRRRFLALMQKSCVFLLLFWRDIGIALQLKNQVATKELG